MAVFCNLLRVCQISQIFYHFFNGKGRSFCHKIRFCNICFYLSKQRDFKIMKVERFRSMNYQNPHFTKSLTSVVLFPLIVSFPLLTDSRSSA